MKQSIVLIFVFGIFSCTKHQQDQIYINPALFKITEIQLSEYAEDVQYIPLSFEIPIKSIRAIDFCDNFIFIGTGTEGMLVYNNDGSLYKKIGNKGRGPGEYYSVNSFSIDPKNKLVYLLDAGPSAKIMVYTFNGVFKYEFSNAHLNGVFQKIVFQNERLYLFEIVIAGSATYDWVEIDLHGEVISKKINSIPKFSTMATLMINPIYLFNGGIGYWNQYNDTIFCIKNSKNSARLFFAKGEHRLPFDNNIDLSNFFLPINIVESNNYIWIVEFNRPKNEVIIIDKNKGSSKLVNSIKNKDTVLPGIFNDLDGGGNFEPRSYNNSDGDEYLVGWVEAYQLKANVASETFNKTTAKYPEKKKELKKLANGLTENDNPVLMLVKLK
jgi:hypothetical protein